MQRQLEITVRDVPHSDALDAHIRMKAAKLEHLCSRITGCRVIVEQEQKHKHQGKLFGVRIDLRVPGAEIAVSHCRDEDVYVAARDAFAAAKRKLDEYMRVHRDEVKPAAPRAGASSAGA
jgi:ribosomal subunit interface protein